MRARYLAAIYLAAILCLTGCTLVLAPGRHAGAPSDAGPDTTVDANVARPDGNVDGGCVFPDNCDGDPSTLADGDCDDRDPTRYPGAPPVCGDGIANDCNAPLAVPSRYSAEVGFVPAVDLASTGAGSTVDVDVFATSAVVVYVRERQVRTRSLLLGEFATGFGAEISVPTPALDDVRAVSIVATASGLSIGVLGTGPTIAGPAAQVPFGAVCPIAPTGAPTAPCQTLIAIDLDETTARNHANAVNDVASINRGASARHVFVEEFPPGTPRLFSVDTTGGVPNMPVPIPVTDAQLAATDQAGVMFWGQNGAAPELGVVRDVTADGPSGTPEAFVVTPTDAAVSVAASSAGGQITFATWHYGSPPGIDLQSLVCGSGTCMGTAPVTFSANTDAIAVPYLQVEEIAGFHVVAAIEDRSSSRTLAFHFAERGGGATGSVEAGTTDGVITDLAITSLDTGDMVRVVPIIVAEESAGARRVWASFFVGCEL